MSIADYKLPDRIRTKHHTSTHFDAGDFLPLNPIPQRAFGDAEDFRRLLNVEKWLEEFEQWRWGRLGWSW